ncbi:hypothetical protein [Bacillus sp. V5-8f]|uniref:hypothetical protein n=1 Tax=Bacillus sp. V5-8f TaxID=2053044 RepID=UPI000C7688CA|nr:hypothetical protein [Bacillus sp. V5-8f]PLT35579.1 hypothetical protein CUU64_02950 [Bacillus sp. V5-8f]
MKKKYLLYIGQSIFTIIILLVIFMPPRGTQADQTTYNVDISTNPANGFLIAENFAPGDMKTSILKVNNNGNLDFNYTVSSSQESGDQALYDRIILTVNDNQGHIYQGPLNGLKDFPLGTIINGGNRDLTFTAELPLETGNDAQGKSTSVAFNFSAVGHEEQIPTDGCFEPPFSNRNFTLHQKSTVPIKFHLRDGMGNLESIERDNVRLEVSGPDAIYNFRVTDGTLDHHDQVDEPHYHARFSTWDYHVTNDMTYTAKVYVGSQVVCQKPFTVLKKGNRSNAP